MSDSKADVARTAGRLQAALMRLDAIGDDASRDAVQAARIAHDAARAAYVARRSEAKPVAGVRPVGRGERMGADTTGLEATVSVRMESVPTSMAHVLARSNVPLVTVDVTSSRERPARVAVKCWVEDYSATAVQSKELARGATGKFSLFPPFHHHRIRGISELTIASLRVEIIDLDGKLETMASYPIPLMPSTTAVLVQEDPSTGKANDLRSLLAAWVTPNAPEIMSFLRTCADFSKLKAMLGYQIDAEGIREHVRAIYDALKAARIVYMNSTIAFGAGAGQFIQRIRLPRESLATASANCLDGTVLMASLLEATGLAPAIVLIPGHAYLGFRPQENADWEYVETTMIGTETYERAVQAATATTAKMKQANEIEIIDVAEMRANGITPIE